MTTLKMFVHFKVDFVAAVVALAFVLPARAEGKQGGTKANETLLSATSPFEDRVEFALAKNLARVEKCLAKSEKQVASAKEHYAVAVCAVEVFRLLLDTLDATKLKVPKEVSLLDFAGFKLHVLDAAPKPDWVAMRTAVAEAAECWKATSRRNRSRPHRNELCPRG